MTEARYAVAPLLCVAIVSDLHAYDATGAGYKPSHLCVTDPEDQEDRHPIAGLRRLIKEESLSADVLLSPGDLGDKADPAGIQYAWRQFLSLQTDFRAAVVAATSGNHDLDSRFKHNGYDAKGVLQALTPPYPLLDETLNDKYWGRNFAIIDRPQVRLLVLNSSAYHGGNESEIEYGRVSEGTLDAIRKQLEGTPARDVNLLLCHHHPQQHMELRLGEMDFMRNGQRLLDILGSGDFGRWLVVHGHKHHPKITYASGPSSAPVVFSSGSLTAVLYAELQTRARNQFHLIEIADPARHNLGLAGIVSSWDWNSGLGWSRATLTSGLPFRCGFGYRGDVGYLSDRIAQACNAETELWSAVRARVPEVDHLVPQDIRTLMRLLLQRHGLMVVENGGEIREIGKAL